MSLVRCSTTSFLDHAWTAESPMQAQSPKAARTHRKQNRCCDQCRKGKRACDATILEDALLDPNASAGRDQRVFHYSDIFGALTPCANCEKTRKKCTFEWLRSQRISQAMPQSKSSPPLKKRRKSDSPAGPETQDQFGKVDQQSRIASASVFLPSEPNGSRSSSTTFDSLDTLRESIETRDLRFAAEVPVLDFSEQRSVLQLRDAEYTTNGKWQTSPMSPSEPQSSSVDQQPARHGNNVSVDTIPEKAIDADQTTDRTERKRKQPSLAQASLHPALQQAHRLTASMDNICMSEGLFKVYQDIFENALTCWLTESACPYNTISGTVPVRSLESDWSNRIYHRVFRLDRLADMIRGRNLTRAEDKVASKAVNSAIVSFSTQWMCSDQGRNIYGKDGGYQHKANGNLASPNLLGISSECSSVLPSSQGFDRRLQVESWHEARLALQEAEGIESFRVVFAQIIFALTQKPLDEADAAVKPAEVYTNGSGAIPPVAEEYRHGEDKAVSECDALLSKLSLTIDREGPPTHLEKGVRLIHSLRCRMNMAGALGKNIFAEMPQPRKGKQKRSLSDVDPMDRATVDLLFWLGIMFDTLASAMYKKPLVVSDEDSDVWLGEAVKKAQGANHSKSVEKSGREPEGFWEIYLLGGSRQEQPLHWPCSPEAAASLLFDAAPVKIVLFRKVTRLQTLLSRNVRDAGLEEAIKEGLEVCAYWEHKYAPFLRDCVVNHDNLPPKIQSWYVGLSGHWHLAVLLLVDLIETIDGAGLSPLQPRYQRASENLVARFRRRSCYVLSDLAKCACRPSGSDRGSKDVLPNQGQGVLLMEPWTVVLIKAFAKAGTLLLLLGWASCSKEPFPRYDEEPFLRAEECVKALWCLGRKSDIAYLAADQLGAALRKKRSACEMVVDSMQQFLNSELWGEEEEFDVFFGVGNLL